MSEEKSLKDVADYMHTQIDPSGGWQTMQITKDDLRGRYIAKSTQLELKLSDADLLFVRIEGAVHFFLGECEEGIGCIVPVFGTTNVREHLAVDEADLLKSAKEDLNQLVEQAST